MKKFFLFTILSIFFISCVKESQEYKSLLAEKDSLSALNLQKTSEVDSFLLQINEIADNFDKLKATEQYVNTDSKGDKLSKAAVKRIADNVVLMNEILTKNKEKIAALEDLVKKGKGNKESLMRTITRLNAQLDNSKLSMDSLKLELWAKDEKLAQLGAENGLLTESNGILSKDNEKKADQIKEQQELLSTAWYVFGSKRELKAQQILTKNGIFSSTKVLRKDFNKDYFVKIDIRNTTSIPLYSKKAKILTNHPIKSYTITEENGTKVLNIKSFVDFWSVSKYLVIEVD